MLIIEQNLNDGSLFSRLPGALGVSLRQLERRFVADLGITLRDYRPRLRLPAQMDPAHDLFGKPLHSLRWRSPSGPDHAAGHVRFGPVRVAWRQEQPASA